MVVWTSFPRHLRVTKVNKTFSITNLPHFQIQDAVRGFVWSDGIAVFDFVLRLAILNFDFLSQLNIR